MTASIRHLERGFTLVEAITVIVLSGVVTIGLLGFYLNSQATWMDGSSQALTQREATLLIESIADRVHEAASYDILPTSPPSGNQMVLLRDKDGNEMSRFSWEPVDSLVHYWDAGVDKGPVTTSVVERFQLAVVSASVVQLTGLQVRAADGARITSSSMFALNNAP